MPAPDEHFEAFLASLGFGDDPELVGTGARVATFLAGFVPDPELPELGRCATSTTAPVVVTGITFHSLCAHHFLPFFGSVAVAYRPRGAVVGLGAIPRLVEHLARRPQLQERLADQVADALMDTISPEAVAIGIRARHLCMEMRGARSLAEVLVVASRGEPDPWLLSRVEDP